MRDEIIPVATERHRDDMERRIAGIWRDVLGTGDAGTFLELHGQSISAVRIVARIEDELGLDVDVAVLFDDPDLPAFIDAVLAAPADRD
ncbi:phosphopantetheine-binding protein [Actinoplanes sp. LDG1-06]|uniref:Phosphopantetheine-binding protein n=1 Tax=Paractinoplanes ovalisporus TaxID=2810368 RepID=A0ABS2AJZ6_9ACTN|nr:phosphopantetheine-binding protein [Actinoplanes ovalisporus]MBM2620131.1 phosphopantetheine-binding protein [Actinoplanes ovalisporus]